MFDSDSNPFVFPDLDVSMIPDREITTPLLFSEPLPKEPRELSAEAEKHYPQLVERYSSIHNDDALRLAAELVAEYPDHREELLQGGPMIAEKIGWFRGDENLMRTYVNWAIGDISVTSSVLDVGAIREKTTTEDLLTVNSIDATKALMGFYATHNPLISSNYAGIVNHPKPFKELSELGGGMVEDGPTFDERLLRVEQEVFAALQSDSQLSRTELAKKYSLTINPADDVFLVKDHKTVRDTIRLIEEAEGSSKQQKELEDRTLTHFAQVAYRNPSIADKILPSIAGAVVRLKDKDVGRATTIGIASGNPELTIGTVVKGLLKANEVIGNSPNWYKPLPSGTGQTSVIALDAVKDRYSLGDVENRLLAISRRHGGEHDLPINPRGITNTIVDGKRTRRTPEQIETFFQAYKTLISRISFYDPRIVSGALTRVANEVLRHLDYDMNDALRWVEIGLAKDYTDAVKHFETSKYFGRESNGLRDATKGIRKAEEIIAARPIEQPVDVYEVTPPEEPSSTIPEGYKPVEGIPGWYTAPDGKLKKLDSIATKDSPSGETEYDIDVYADTPPEGTDVKKLVADYEPAVNVHEATPPGGFSLDSKVLVGSPLESKVHLEKLGEGYEADLKEMHALAAEETDPTIERTSESFTRYIRTIEDGIQGYVGRIPQTAIDAAFEVLTIKENDEAALDSLEMRTAIALGPYARHNSETAADVLQVLPAYTSLLSDEDLIRHGTIALRVGNSKSSRTAEFLDSDEGYAIAEGLARAEEVMGKDVRTIKLKDIEKGIEPYVTEVADKYSITLSEGSKKQRAIVGASSRIKNSVELGIFTAILDESMAALEPSGNATEDNFYRLMKIAVDSPDPNNATRYAHITAELPSEKRLGFLKTNMLGMYVRLSLDKVSKDMGYTR